MDILQADQELQNKVVKMKQRHGESANWPGKFYRLTISHYFSFTQVVSWLKSIKITGLVHRTKLLLGLT